MKKRNPAKHYIDIVFLMVVFFVLTISSLSVLLLSVNSYKRVVLANESNASARTAGAYIREMVHQHDERGKISLDYLGGLPSIRIDEGDGYYLYIYEYEGELRELNASLDSGADWKDGVAVMELSALSIDKLSDRSVLEITVEDVYGNIEVIDVGIKSEGGFGYDKK